MVSLAARQLGDQAGVALLFSTSQGEFHAPWAAFVGGVAYVVESDAVGRALASLDGTLKKSELRKLVDASRD